MRWLLISLVHGYMLPSRRMVGSGQLPLGIFSDGWLESAVLLDSRNGLLPFLRLTRWGWV